ncbi:hypothetical protein [Polaromonas sp. CG_9.11]|uniref:hypothetical protein n=1 Tax=Polaromonas sp. CG_9.11 TaxID=2787730 RepID=UPI0018CB27EC|nr:hypothetical protein [Polaromonas sp. CG_9.11]MBG6077985.1 hypothetical protein [Polaromonas sp. CG_9.11]
MKVEGTIEKFALAVAIGSLLLLGAFLIVDSITDGFLEEFEKYSGSNAWAVVAAIPAVTFAYILGAFVQVLSDLAIRRMSPKAEDEEWQVLERLARAESETLTSQYDEIRRAKKLLEGCLFPLLVLAAGIFLERARLPHLSALLITCSAAVAVAAGSIPFIASRLHKALVRVGNIADAINKDPKGRTVDA